MSPVVPIEVDPDDLDLDRDRAAAAMTPPSPVPIDRQQSAGEQRGNRGCVVVRPGSDLAPIAGVRCDADRRTARCLVTTRHRLAARG